MKKNIFKNIFGAISCVSLALGGLVILASCDEETDTTHTHEFSGAYLSDSTGHWQVCSCGEKGEVSAHTYGQYTVVKAATEDAAGTEERTCSVCSYLDSKEIAKLAHTHTFGSWSVKTEPTATTKGELERVCSKDKTHTETFELPVLNDTDYTVTTVDATCTTKGSKTYKYTKDEEVLTVATVDIDALGHSYGNYVETTKPTTTSKGLLTRTCSRCSAEDTLELPMLNTTDYTYTVTKEATYTSEGVGTYTYTVGSQTFKYDVVISATRTTKSVEGTTAAELQASFASLLNTLPASQEDEGWYSIKLAAGTYTFTNVTNNITNKTVYIKGSEDVIIEMQENYYGCNGTTLTFDGVSIKAYGGNYSGFAHTAAVNFIDCKITNGTLFLYSDTVFTNCTFELHTNAYCVWTYAAENVLFDSCTFNTSGKAIYVYNEKCQSASKEDYVQFVANITIKDTVFNDDDALNLKKAAVETGDQHRNSSNEVELTAKCNVYNIVISNTTVNGFAINDEGTNTNSTYYGNKNALPATNLSVTIDGVKVY